MKRNIFIGIGLGAIAGLLDVIPMIVQKLTWDANIAAFTMWLVIGFFLSVITLKMNVVLRGILVTYLVFLPSAVLIGWKEPVSLLPILLMATILGGFLGFSVHRFTKKSE